MLLGVDWGPQLAELGRRLWLQLVTTLVVALLVAVSAKALERQAELGRRRWLQLVTAVGRRNVLERVASVVSSQ